MIPFFGKSGTSRTAARNSSSESESMRRDANGMSGNVNGG
jgi:hypothetical protein